MPFTPRVIPKNQKRIAKAVGAAVSEQLLTKEDMLERIKSSEIKTEFVKSVTELILQTDSSGNEKKQADIMQKLLPENISDDIADRMAAKLEETDLTPVIKEVGDKALKDYLQNPMISMFLNENMLESIYKEIDSKIQNYMHGDGRIDIRNFVQEKTEGIQGSSFRELLETLKIDENMLSELLGSLFDSFISSCGSGLMEKLDINGIVTEKIEKMKVEDLEELVMSVMKQELQAVINLGAVIGAIIGIINVFI